VKAAGDAFPVKLAGVSDTRSQFPRMNELVFEVIEEATVQI
jgi:hypothetical protein